MLVGYVRVSKSDGSQVLDLQRDALLEGGVDPLRIKLSDLSCSHGFKPRSPPPCRAHIPQ